MKNSNKKNSVKQTKKVSIPKIKWFWKYNENDKNFSRPISSAQILINGKLVVFVFCSLVSAFINLVFISNLTKSDYNIGTLIAVPAAVLLGSLSVGLDIAKFLLAIQVNTLGELIRKLSKFSWVKNVKKAAFWWRAVYVTFIMLSVITSVSLSSISIGAGITRNANLIKQIDEYIIQGEQYTNINAGADAVTRENLISKATDTSEKDAREYAESSVEIIEEFIAKISPIVHAEYVDDSSNTGLTAAQKKDNALKPYESERMKVNNILRNAGYRARTFDELATFNTLNLANDLKQKRLEYLRSNSNDIAVEKLGELKDNTNTEIMSWLETLNALSLINPKTNEPVIFDVSTEKPANVLAKSATQILKALRVDVENDSGDIGSSSKIFMQIGSIFASKKLGDNDLQAALNVKAEGSFGATEVMMMCMLLFLSLLCELAINLFSPKTNISRKMLSQFSQYFDNDFNVNDFMLEIYLDQLNFGVLDKSAFDRKAKKAVELTEITKETIYNLYSQKTKDLQAQAEDKLNSIKAEYESKIEEGKRESDLRIEALQKEVSDLKAKNKEIKKSFEQSANSTENQTPKENTRQHEERKVNIVQNTERKISSPKKEDVKVGFSSDVDDLINEIEAIE